VFIGTLETPGRASEGLTVAANPHLKPIFGYPDGTPEEDVAPLRQSGSRTPLARARFSNASKPSTR
jgi:hypothetical protein